MFQQLAALQPRPACTQGHTASAWRFLQQSGLPNAHAVSIATTTHSRLFAHRMKYLTKLQTSAIFFWRVVSVEAVTLDLLDCKLSVSLWT